MGDHNIYDLCIVGAGLIGSSAARHASLNPNVKVCLVGPDEPQVRKGNKIFGAWFDEGRITRQTTGDLVWAQLASSSIKGYRALEERTGIKFYNPVGCLVVGDKDTTYMTDTSYSATSRGIPVDKLSSTELQRKFPYLQVFDNDAGLCETIAAGYTNPRHLRDAQLTAAHLQGCDFVKDIAIQVKEESMGSNPSSKMMKVLTQGGTAVHAKRVLLAVGAFSDYYDLFPPGIRPDIGFAAQTVIFAELGKHDLERLKKMPSMVYASSGLARANKTTEQKYRSYILPPIEYPNGKTYLKLGHGPQFEPMFTTPEEITNWYINTAPQEFAQGLKDIMLSLFKGLSPLSYHTDTCVSTRTPSRRPYIDMVTPSLGVALGGNGYAAKSCDEIGRIAADLILTNEWTSDIPKDAFKLVLRSSNSKL